MNCLDDLTWEWKINCLNLIWSIQMENNCFIRFLCAFFLDFGDTGHMHKTNSSTIERYTKSRKNHSKRCPRSASTQQFRWVLQTKISATNTKANRYESSIQWFTGELCRFIPWWLWKRFCIRCIFLSSSATKLWSKLFNSTKPIRGRISATAICWGSWTNYRNHNQGQQWNSSTTRTNQISSTEKEEGTSASILCKIQ